MQNLVAWCLSQALRTRGELSLGGSRACARNSCWAQFICEVTA